MCWSASCSYRSETRVAKSQKQCPRQSRRLAYVGIESTATHIDFRTTIASEVVMILVDVHYEDCCSPRLAPLYRGVSSLHGLRQRLTSQSRRSDHTPLYIFVLESATLLTATNRSLCTPCVLCAFCATVALSFPYVKVFDVRPPCFSITTFLWSFG